MSSWGGGDRQCLQGTPYHAVCMQSAVWLRRTVETAFLKFRSQVQTANRRQLFSSGGAWPAQRSNLAAPSYGLLSKTLPDDFEEEFSQRLLEEFSQRLLLRTSTTFRGLFIESFKYFLRSGYIFVVLAPERLKVQLITRLFLFLDYCASRAR